MKQEYSDADADADAVDDDYDVRIVDDFYQ